MPDTTNVYASAVKQLAHHEDRLAKLRHGLRELKIEAAAQSLAADNGNSARAAFARFEGLLDQLLTIAGVLLLICLAATPAAAAPAPVPTNGVQIVGFDGLTFRYAITLASTSAVAAAPDCHGTAIIALCGAHVTSVTGLPATWDVNAVTITGAPVGTSYVTITTDQPMNAMPVAWTLRTDDGRSYSGATSGPTCGPNAVTLSGFGAASTDDGIEPRDLFGLTVLGLLFFIVVRVRTRTRGK